MENPFQYTARVTFELSNLCNYAVFHQSCPLHRETTHLILPQKIVNGVLDCLQKYRFQGIIAFHNYNEPLIDPRLFLFIKTAKEKCPQCSILIWTNGYYLNQVIMDELVEFGVTQIIVTAYNEAEFERISALQTGISLEVKRAYFDDRLNLYDKEPVTEDLRPCHAPLHDILITRDAKVGLCCFDWKRQHCFGDLNEANLEQIIFESDLLSVYRELSAGRRIFDICKVCGWSR